VQLQANCRERDVFIIQPLVRPVQEHLVELLLMTDAARGASAARVTAVIPHFAYARSDKKDKPRISIGARLVADLLVTAGVNRVLTLTLHSPQVHGFFSVPVDHLHALREFAGHFRRRDLSHAVVVAPDLGYAKSAADFARRLGLPVAAGAKERISDTEVRITAIIGDVTGRDVIVLHARPVRRQRAGQAGRRRRDRGGVHRHGARSPRPPEAARPFGGSRPGRGDQPHPQRRVGQLAVRALAARLLGRSWTVLIA